MAKTTNKPHVPRTYLIPDGPVWCEGCQDTLPNRAAWDRHKPVCPNRKMLVDYRG
jgi:hypothetical protein